MSTKKGFFMKFFTSDLHAQHRNIVKFTNRGTETTIEAHDDWLVAKVNERVTDADLLYHLGDFSFAKSYDEIAEFCAKLNGQKIFLKGNHDKRENLNRLVKDGLIQAWYDYKEIKIGDNSVVLFHFPIASWHKQGHGSWHLHGHSHSNLKGEHSQGKILDVGIDNAFTMFGDHFVFSEKDIEYHMEHEEVYIADLHRENI